MLLIGRDQPWHFATIILRLFSWNLRSSCNQSQQRDMRICPSLCVQDWIIWTWLDFIVFIITYPIKIWVLEFGSQHHQLDWTPIKHPSRAAAEENFPAPQGRGADTREQRHPDRRDSRNSEVWWSLMSCWFRQIPHDPTVPAVLGCLCLMCSLSPLSRLVPRSRTFWPALRHRRHPVDEILSTRWNEAR